MKTGTLGSLMAIMNPSNTLEDIQQLSMYHVNRLHTKLPQNLDRLRRHPLPDAPAPIGAPLASTIECYSAEKLHEYPIIEG
jgi:hypothetical protein